MTPMTHPERLAAIEAHQNAHRREHDLTDRVWSAKLDALDARLRGIERILLEVRLPSPTESAVGERKSLFQRRDVGIVSGSAAVTSLLWWLADVAQGIIAGG